MKIKILFFLLFLSNVIFGQLKLDQKIDNYIALCQFDSAAIYTQKAIKQSKNKKELLANHYIKYSIILKGLAKKDSCFYFLDKAEEFYTQTNDQSKLFYILTIKAEIARSLVKRNIANNYIHKAEKLLSKNKNLDYKFYFFNRRIALLAEYYNNVADSVVKIKEISNFILQNQKEIKDKSIVAYTLNEIGYLDFHRNHKNAKEYFLKAYQIAEKYDSKIAFVDISINLGRYFQQIENNYPKAIFYYQNGLKQAKKINNLWQIQQIYNELKNTTTLSKDYKNSLFFSDSLNHINGLINEYSSNKKYELLENKFIIESKEKELLSAKKIFLLLMIVLVLFVIGITVLYFYSKKISSKNKLLSKLYKENQFLIGETNHRVNNNLQLISILISDTLKKKQSEENKNDFIKLLSKVETIASLHKHLYLTKNKNKINLHNYLLEVKSNFKDIAFEKSIKLDCEIEEIEIDSDSAMYIGLLVTELIINSVKYSFEENQEKNINLNIQNIENILLFTFEDNGQKAIGKTITPKLALQLCLQLGVDPKIDTNKGFKLTFKK